jgi:hypothetical protein
MRVHHPNFTGSSNSALILLFADDRESGKLAIIRFGQFPLTRPSLIAITAPVQTSRP